MAEQSGWCFVVGKSTLCRWKVSSFSRGFCVPGARGSGGWRGAGRTWKNTDNADSDQSLSPAASCCRSRFVVAGKEERKVCRSQADSTLTLAKDESLLES